MSVGLYFIVSSENMKNLHVWISSSHSGGYEDLYIVGCNSSIDLFS
jgi:hypothetical protein